MVDRDLTRDWYRDLVPDLLGSDFETRQQLPVLPRQVLIIPPLCRKHECGREQADKRFLLRRLSTFFATFADVESGPEDVYGQPITD